MIARMNKSLREELLWRLEDLDQQLQRRATLFNLTNHATLGEEFDRLRRVEVGPILTLVRNAKIE